MSMTFFRARLFLIKKKLLNTASYIDVLWIGNLKTRTNYPPNLLHNANQP